jgi:spermidine synthase
MGKSRSSRPRRARIELGRDGEHLELLIDGISYSTWHHESPWSGYVWDAIGGAVLLRPGPAPKVLLLGCGAGTALAIIRRLKPEARLQAVEIEARVLELARREFSLDELGADIRLGDGLAFLAATRRRYDVIIDDMFGPGEDGLVRPVEDETAHLHRIRDRLAPGGLALTNSTSDDDPPGLEGAVRRAYLEVFPECCAVLPKLGSNVVLAGSDEPLLRDALRSPAARDSPADFDGLRSLRVRKT